MIGPKLLLILNLIRISDKGCANVYKQLLNNNNNVINEIRSKWTSKLNEEIYYSLVAINYCTTNDTFVRLIQFKLAHHRVVTNALLFKMNFVASPTCLWRQMELWTRKHIDKYYKLSDVEKIFCADVQKQTINAIIMATKEVICRKR